MMTKYEAIEEGLQRMKRECVGMEFNFSRREFSISGRDATGTPYRLVGEDPAGLLIAFATGEK